jgi:hypothetical protein
LTEFSGAKLYTVCCRISVSISIMLVVNVVSIVATVVLLNLAAASEYDLVPDMDPSLTDALLQKDPNENWNCSGYPGRYYYCSNCITHWDKPVCLNVSRNYLLAIDVMVKFGSHYIFRAEFPDRELTPSKKCHNLTDFHSLKVCVVLDNRKLAKPGFIGCFIMELLYNDKLIRVFYFDCTSRLLTDEDAMKMSAGVFTEIKEQRSAADEL